MATKIHVECEIVYIEVIPSSALPSSSSRNGRDSCFMSSDDIPDMSLISASSGMFSVRMEQNTEDQLKEIAIRFDRFNDVHKHSVMCGVALFSLNNIRSIDDSSLKRIFKQFIPGYGPILRKDEDYFLFLTRSESLTEKLLLSDDFGSKIKYKVAFIRNINASVGLEVKTVQTYSIHGGPSMRTISLEDEGKDSDSEVSTFGDIFPDFTRNFYGKIFKMSIPKVDFRFEMAWNPTLEKFVPKRGFYKWWLDDAMHRFNFTYYLFRSSSGGGTGKLVNNTWVGAMSDILDGSADWAFVIGHILSRHTYVEWSAPLSYEQMVFLSHRPRTFVSPKAIFWPFAPLMWALFLMTLVLVPLIFKWIAKTKGYSWTYLSMLEYVFATLLEQDNKQPYTSPVNSIKILGIFWLLSAMIISVAYKCKLTALLAFPVSSWIPTTFADLARSDFRVALNVVGKGGAAYSILASSQSPVYKKIFARAEIDPKPDECLLKAAQVDLGCITWLGVAEYISARNLTDRNGNNPIQPSKEITNFIADGLVWEKRAVFRKHLDTSIWSAIETGLVPRWQELDQRFIKAERWKNENTETSRMHMQDQGPKKLKIMHFKGIFYIHFIGLLISGIILACEKFICRQKNQMSRNLQCVEGES